MKFISMSAQNFMSFKSVSFNFPESGLYFVGGEISDSQASNSNGAGKSALFEILSWALFGNTIRNIRTEDIINWHEGKNCCAKVIWRESDKEFTVMRFRGDKEFGNELFFLQGEQDLRGSSLKDTEQRIADALGMSWQVFSSAIIFGERAKAFAEASDADKKRIFDEILMLQQYQEAQTRVKDDIKDLKMNIVKAESSLDLIAQTCSRDERDLVEIDENLAKFAAKCKQSAVEIEHLAVERSQLAEQEQTLAKKLEERANDLLELQNQAKIVFQQYRTIEAEKNEKLQEDSKDLTLNKIMIGDRSAKIDKINRWLSGVERMPQNERCPTCGQAVSEESVNEVLAHYADEIEKYDDELAMLKTKVNEAELKITTVRSTYDAKLKEILIVKEDLDKTTQDSNTKAREMMMVQNRNKTRIAVIDQEIKHLKDVAEAEERPLIERKKTLQDALMRHSKERISIQTSKDQLFENLSLLEFWSEGFGNKGIKSFLLDEVVPLLNSRVSYYASSLLDEEVTIEFDTQSVLRSGDTRDKFNIRIQIAGQLADYKQLSSGEKGRVDTAVLLSLQSLIFGRSVRGSNLVIMDELFEHLDIVGIERVVSLLREEAKDKSLFVISHQSEFADFFDNVLVVKKKDGFSYLEA